MPVACMHAGISAQTCATDDDKRSCSDSELSLRLEFIHRWANYSQPPRCPLYAIEHRVIIFRKARACRRYTGHSIEITKRPSAAVFLSCFYNQCSMAYMEKIQPVNTFTDALYSAEHMGTLLCTPAYTCRKFSSQKKPCITGLKGDYCLESVLNLFGLHA